MISDLNEVSGTRVKCFVCSHLLVQRILSWVLRRISDHTAASITARIKYRRFCRNLAYACFYSLIPHSSYPSFRVITHSELWLWQGKKQNNQKTKTKNQKLPPNHLLLVRLPLGKTLGMVTWIELLVLFVGWLVLRFFVCLFIFLVIKKLLRKHFTNTNVGVGWIILVPNISRGVVFFYEHWDQRECRLQAPFITEA